MSALPRARPTTTGVLWGNLAPGDHVCQLYRADSAFVDALESFVGSALRTGGSAVVIATAAHLHALEKRLRVGRWIDLDRARWEGRYIAVLARETLERFMVDGWPDEELFNSTAASLIARARGSKARPVRVFAEMVALTWADGNSAATLRLEQLWSSLAARDDIALFCAYPQAAFADKPITALHEVCAAHHRLIPDLQG